MDLFFESSFKPPHLQPSQGPRRRVCLRGSMMVMCEVALQSEISTLKRRQAAPVKFLRTGSQSLPTQAGCAGFAVCKQPVILDCGSVQPKHCSALRPTCVSCPPKALSSCPMWCSPQRHVLLDDQKIRCRRVCLSVLPGARKSALQWDSVRNGMLCSFVRVDS